MASATGNKVVSIGARIAYDIKSGAYRGRYSTS
jgi:hypothetical protein